VQSAVVFTAFLVAPAAPTPGGTPAPDFGAFAESPPARARQQYLINGHAYEDHPDMPGWVRLVGPPGGAAPANPFPVASGTTPPTGATSAGGPFSSSPAPVPYPALTLTGVRAGMPFGTNCLTG
jgi:hypothetical protein